MSLVPTLVNKHVLQQLLGSHAIHAAQDAEAVNLHLDGVAQLLFLDRGAQLELSNLSVSGALPFRAGHVLQRQ